MPSKITMRDAARVARVQLSDMRVLAETHSLHAPWEPHTSPSEMLDEAQFFKWLKRADADADTKALVYESEQYEVWLRENGEFLRRFLRDEGLLD